MPKDAEEKIIPYKYIEGTDKNEICDSVAQLQKQGCIKNCANIDVSMVGMGGSYRAWCKEDSWKLNCRAREESTWSVRLCSPTCKFYKSAKIARIRGYLANIFYNPLKAIFLFVVTYSRGIGKWYASLAPWGQFWLSMVVIVSFLPNVLNKIIQILLLTK